MSPELKNVSDFALFARVVEFGSITQCAANLGYERTTVSRRISALEGQLGVRLLERTTKSVSVTSAGRRCYEQCAVILRAAQEAHFAALNSGTSKAHVPLKLGTSISVVESFLTPILDDYRIRNPLVELELQLIDVWTDDNIESVDIGLALGPVRLRNAWSSKIARARQVLCASPQYIANAGELSSLDDLTAHPSIVDESVKHLAMLSLAQGDSHWRTRIYIRYTVPGLLEARQAAIAGLGIACLPLFMCDQQLRAGQLAVLLPDYEPVARDLFLISPKAAVQKRNPTTLRLYLESALGNRLL